MAALYEMTNDFAELFEQYDAITECEFESDGKGGYVDDDGNPVDPEAYRKEMQEAWFDTLDGMEQALVEKAENVAVYIKSLESEAKQLKAEEDRLKARRQSKENSAKNMRSYLMRCMETAKIAKIDKPKAVISVKDSPESVEISDSGEFIKWAESGHDDYLRYKGPEVNKPAVKAALKAGENIPFAVLARSRSLTIK
nr:MAG TPA: resistance protein [Bacteriophage sp.]